jgi:hypothetical protein
MGWDGLGLATFGFLLAPPQLRLPHLSRFSKGAFHQPKARGISLYSAG